MRKTIIAVASAALLSLAACGDDDSPAADDASADDASADDTAAAASDDFCGQFEALQDRFDDLDVEADDAFGDDSEFEAAIGELQDIDPPSEIADDWNTITDALSGFADIPADLSDDEMLEEFMSRFGAFDQEEMERASQNVENYVRDECGIDLG